MGSIHSGIGTPEYVYMFCAADLWSVLLTSLFLDVSQDPPPLRGRQPPLSVSGNSGCLWNCHQCHRPVGALCPALCRRLGLGQEVRGSKTYLTTMSRTHLIICCSQVKRRIPFSRLLTVLRRGGSTPMKLLLFTPLLWCCAENLGSCLLLLHIETWWSTPLCFHGNQRWYQGDNNAWPPGLAAPQFTTQMMHSQASSSYQLTS